MEYLSGLQQFSGISLAVICLCVCFVGKGNSAGTPDFVDLCRFEGFCLNCTEGGCEDMCNFYDNNCCAESPSETPLLEKWQYECVRKFPDMYDLHLDCRGSFDGVYGVYMVTKCSGLWKDDSIKAKCEDSIDDDILSNIPVYDSLHEIVTYKNMYCAFCNNLDLGSLRFWKFDLMCNDGLHANTSDYDAEFMYGNCFLRLLYKEHRMCAMDVTESCSIEKKVNPSLKYKCENGLSQNVYAWQNERRFNVYKNEFCAKCNFETGELQCWAFQAFSCWPQELPSYTSVQAMVSLNLKRQKNKDSIVLYNSTCREGGLYDPFRNECLNITCLTSQNLCLSGECHLAEVVASDFETEIQNDSSLYFLPLGIFIPDGRYFPKDSKVYICLNRNQSIEFEILQQTTFRTTVITTTTQAMESTLKSELTSTSFSNGSTAISKRTTSGDISIGMQPSPVLTVILVCLVCCFCTFNFS